MKLKFILILSIFLLSVSVHAQKNNYIGYKHKGVVYGDTLPNGAKDMGGGLLSSGDYGITRFTKGNKYMLWLEKITERDRKGIPSLEVKDVLTFGKQSKNQEFLFSYSSPCVLNGRNNLDLIVRTEFLPKTNKYKVLDAWKANIKKERFEKISTDKIKCEYVAP